MYLSSGWFGGRLREASAQLREAGRGGFQGIAVLPGDPALELDAQLETSFLETRLEFGAAAWGAGRNSAASAGSFRPGPWRWEIAGEHFPALVRRLQRLQCKLLVLPAGLDERAEIGDRGARLLSRLRIGEDLDPGDEAIEEFRRLERGPRERQLEVLARFLFELRRREPGLGLALAADPSPAGLLTPESLALLYADASLAGVGLWYDPGVSEARFALGFDEPGQWLQNAPGRILGVSLHDAAAGRDRLFPGEGRVDFRLLGEYLPRRAVRVLHLAPTYPWGALGEARHAFAALGLP